MNDRADHALEREPELTVELVLDPDQVDAADEAIVRWLIGLMDDDGGRHG